MGGASPLKDPRKADRTEVKPTMPVVFALEGNPDIKAPVQAARTPHCAFVLPARSVSANPDGTELEFTRTPCSRTHSPAKKTEPTERVGPRNV